MVHFLPMEVLLDDHVGHTVAVEVERGGHLITANIKVWAQLCWKGWISTFTTKEGCWLCDCQLRTMIIEGQALCVKIISVSAHAVRSKIYMRCHPALSWRRLAACCMA